MSPYRKTVKAVNSLQLILALLTSYAEHLLMKPISIHGKDKALRKNRKGGIEGLPLQLMIIIMVATLGTAIIIGWMGNIEEPHSISRVVIMYDLNMVRSKHV